MKNIFVPKSFLAVAFNAERNLLKTDNHLLDIHEEVKTASSPLYRLFFHDLRREVQPTLVDQPVSEIDYYSSYE